MTPLFSQEELIKFGWLKTKSHFIFMVGLLFVVFLIAAAVGENKVLSILVAVFASITIINISLIIASGGKPKLKDLPAKYTNFKMIASYIISSLLEGVAVLAGLFLLVVPGIYLALRLQFYKFLIVEKEDIGPIMALKKSWRMTEGHTWNLLLFMIMISFLNVFGMLLLGIGIFVTIPISVIAYALLYKKLLAGVSLVKV
ncbi:MAG: hypothetical protein AAB355_01605 [Patescibacteria group bacterium]